MPDPLSPLRHEIRGMLNAMRLCVAALGKPVPTPDKLEFLDDVELAADRLIALLDELIALPLPAEAGDVR
jgi:hypothetical protein